MQDQQINKIKKYLIYKYQGRLSLKINQAADEFLINREEVKRLKHDGRLKSLSCGVIAAYIVNNPPIKNVEAYVGK